FFRRFYTPDNTTIIVAGDVEHARLIELVREKYGNWRGRRDNPRIPREPEPRRGKVQHVEWQGSSPPRILMGWRTPAFETQSGRGPNRSGIRDTAALQVIHGLAFAESSPLYQQLVVNERKLL